MKRKIESKTAHKEQIAAQPGGDTLLVQRQRFIIAQPQNFLCYPGQSMSARGLGQGPQQAQKTTRFPERKIGGFVNLGTRWHCLQGYIFHKLYCHVPFQPIKYLARGAYLWNIFLKKFFVEITSAPAKAFLKLSRCIHAMNTEATADKRISIPLP